ncbi:SAF domain-containing protein [Micromonospora sp. WMMD975]|uniref:SAF domain-containing protein n=1 Tax=Micromonospora sp. WMMD975 TaxID=3016087 RepID=UPI00249AE75F|nr:SAF domain-containing protein [Micromonospora sp. WMMD975]WFE33135.1 SAF domain-containing protein [Micromonospora sp. WMMD975]
MSMVASRNGTPVEAPVAPPKVVRQRRIRPGLLGLAILLIAVGGLGAAFAVTSVRSTGTYLAVARPVEVGQQITADDLVPVQLSGGRELRPVPADRMKDLLGLRAAVRLTPGTLLTTTHLTDAPLLGPGQQQIALGLAADQVPARKLHPGDKVLLVSTPDSSSSGAEATRGGTRFEATVIDTAVPASSDVVVYLALAVRDVPAVVVLAADDRVALVLVEAA